MSTEEQTGIVATFVDGKFWTSPDATQERTP